MSTTELDQPGPMSLDSERPGRVIKSQSVQENLYNAFRNGGGAATDASKESLLEDKLAAAAAAAASPPMDSRSSMELLAADSRPPKSLPPYEAAANGRPAREPVYGKAAGRQQKGLLLNGGLNNNNNNNNSGGSSSNESSPVIHPFDKGWPQEQLYDKEFQSLAVFPEYHHRRQQQQMQQQVTSPTGLKEFDPDRSPTASSSSPQDYRHHQHSQHRHHHGQQHRQADSPPDQMSQDSGNDSLHTNTSGSRGSSSHLGFVSSRMVAGGPGGENFIKGNNGNIYQAPSLLKGENFVHSLCRKHCCVLCYACRSNVIYGAKELLACCVMRTKVTWSKRITCMLCYAYKSNILQSKRITCMLCYAYKSNVRKVMFFRAIVSLCSKP